MRNDRTRQGEPEGVARQVELRIDKDRVASQRVATRCQTRLEKLRSSNASRRAEDGRSRGPRLLHVTPTLGELERETTGICSSAMAYRVMEPK